MEYQVYQEENGEETRYKKKVGEGIGENEMQRRLIYIMSCKR